MKKLVPWLALTFTACTALQPPRDTSTQNRIGDELKKAAVPQAKDAAPLPPSVSTSLLPPIRMPMPKASSRQLEQRFDLVVNDAPVNQVLMGIVADTPYSILLKPKSVLPFAPSTTANGAAGAVPVIVDGGGAEKITVNLKDVTVFEALDAIRELYGYDYTVEGKRIYVQPPELQTRLYQVNYIVGQRRGVSDLQVVGGASIGGSSSSSSTSSGSTTSSGTGTASGSGSGSTYSSVQASALSTLAKSDVWGEIEDALRTTLGCHIPKNLPGRVGGAGMAGGGGSMGGTSSSSSASAGRADVSYHGDMQSGERMRGVDGCVDGRALTINQMSGTILVRGMPTELRLIGKLLQTMQLNIERQVIIEAKIIDVELNSQSQQGINWSQFNNGLHRFSVGASTTRITEPGGGGGTTLYATSDDPTKRTFSSTLGDVLGNGVVGAAGSAFSAGLGVAMQFRNFSALLNFLQTQGQVHVLSSPRIATLNNQKAVLKVGTDEPFVSSISGGQTVNNGGGNSTTTPPNLNYQPFFSGVALDVTPQIDDKDNITLHVHALVNSIVEKQKVAAPTTNSVLVPFAVNTINETDSVVKTRDGQVIVIGGLMTESTSDDRAKTPAAGDVPLIGAFFRKGSQGSTKRELVILLKPTVVKDDSTWANEIAGVQERIERLGAKGGASARAAEQ